MRAMIEEDNEQEVNKNILGRLLQYAKPYIKYMIFVFLMILAITGLDLLRPILVGDAIDTYIDGYDIPYYEVEEDTKGAVSYRDVYLKKVTDSNHLDASKKYYQLFLYRVAVGHDLCYLI